MLINAALASLFLVGLSGCRQIEKLTGAPHRLDNAEAAARYLDIVCPGNLETDTMNQKTDKKLQQLKSGNLTDLEFGKYLDSFLLQTASRNFRSVQATTDPRFIWPESVRRVTTEWAAAEMESAAASREFVKYGGFTAAVKARETLPKLSELGGGAEQRASDKASTIRAILRLPERGEACKNGKRSLTLEQIKKLQGA